MASRTAEMVMDGSSERGLWRVILASAVGTMIEWYDFYIFGSLAAILSLKYRNALNYGRRDRADRIVADFSDGWLVLADYIDFDSRAARTGAGR